VGGVRRDNGPCPGGWGGYRRGCVWVAAEQLKVGGGGLGGPAGAFSRAPAGLCCWSIPGAIHMSCAHPMGVRSMQTHHTTTARLSPLAMDSWCRNCRFHRLGEPRRGSYLVSPTQHVTLSLFSPDTTCILCLHVSGWFLMVEGFAGVTDFCTCRVIQTKMPKHLFSGKRPKGSTDRR
jgi:hypothetical protein